MFVRRNVGDRIERRDPIEGAFRQLRHSHVGVDKLGISDFRPSHYVCVLSGIFSRVFTQATAGVRLAQSWSRKIDKRSRGPLEGDERTGAR